jgi:uncharacterized membrane protein YgdD (TMEM256/DUF423 family)
VNRVGKRDVRTKKNYSIVAHFSVEAVSPHPWCWEKNDQPSSKPGDRTNALKHAYTVGWIALSGFFAVVMGAFGAHGISAPVPKAWITLGSQQHMAHTLALLACVWLHTQGLKQARLSMLFFAFGIFFFSGALYAMALGAPRAIAMAAPLGGLCLLVGWLTLARAAFSAKDVDDGTH